MLRDVRRSGRALAAANPIATEDLKEWPRSDAGQAILERVLAQPIAFSRPVTVAPGRRGLSGLRGWVPAALLLVLAGSVVAMPQIMEGKVQLGATAAAAEALDQASTVASARPFVVPAPTDWVYIKSLVSSSGDGSHGVALGGDSVDRFEEYWYRADGELWALTNRAGELTIGDLDSSATFPPTSYAEISRLPTDPEHLLSWARDGAGVAGVSEKSQNSSAFRTLQALLEYGVLPPTLESSVFQALKRIPNVTLVSGVEDGAGRAAIGIGRVEEEWLRVEVLLDPDTFRYLGHRSVTVRDRMIGKTLVPTGTSQVAEVRVAGGVVPSAGKRLPLDEGLQNVNLVAVD